MTTKIVYVSDGSGNDLARRLGPITGPLFNVRDPTYGAKGDGTTDDTAAIASAIAAAVAAGGGTVHLPQGTYLVTRNSAADSITADNIRVSGAGPGTIIKNAAAISGGGGQQQNAFSATGRSGLVLENLAVDGFTVCNFAGCSDVTVRGVHAVGQRGTDLHDKGAYFHQCEGVRVEGNHFRNYTFHVYLSGDATTRTRDVVVSGNTFKNDVAAGGFTSLFPVGVYVYFADDVTVSGNTIRNIYSSLDNGNSGTGMGYGVYEGDGACTSLAITGNVFVFTGNGLKRSTGIYVNYATVATITGNVFRSTAGAGMKNAIRCSVKVTPAFRTVSDNVIDGSGLVTSAGEAQAIAMDVSGAPTSPVGALVAQDNIVYAGRIRVDLTGRAAPKMTVKVNGNVLEGCPGNAGAIIVTGTTGRPVVEADVSHNTIRNAAGSAIVLAFAPRATVCDNRIKNCNTGNGTDEVGDLSGVVFSSFSYGGLVTGNVVVNTPGGGGHIKYGVNLFSTTQLFRFVYHHNLAFGLAAGGSLYRQGYTAAPTGGWDWGVGDFATNASLGVDKPVAWWCVARTELTLTADATAGQSTLALSSTDALLAGDTLFLWADASTIDIDAVSGDTTRYHTSAILSVDGPNQVTLASAIPTGKSFSAASAGVRALRWKAGPSIGTAALTSTQVTDLTDGGDSALHFHSADRARANHTGTQALSTITGGTAPGGGYTLPDLTLGKAADGGGGFVRLVDDGGALRWAAGISTGVGAREYIIYDWVQDQIRFRIDATTGLVTVEAGLLVHNALRHDGSTAGFFGVTPASRPSALVQTYSTADRTLGAYTANAQGTAYTGATDGEAKLADLNALRVAYENLRAFVEDLAQHHNALVDDLQALGLER